MKFKEFAWQGFMLEVPEEWQLIEEGGNSLSGKLSFQTDDASLRLEWKPISKKKPMPIRDITEKFTEKLRKKAKRNVKIRKGSINIQEHKAASVQFRTNVEGQGFFWYCKPTNRFFMIEFLTRKEAKIPKHVIEHVVKSFTCHGLKGRTWSILGFSFETPKSFELETRKFVVGKGILLFQEKRRNPLTETRTSVLFEYFSMANVQFEDTYMEPHRWFDDYYVDGLKKRFGKPKLEEHSDLQIKGHSVKVIKGTASSGWTWRKKVGFIIAFWYCPGSNRIYVMMVSDEITRPIFLRRRLEEDDLKQCFQDVVETIQCHGSSAD
ncbi:MAG: hypothetical protein PVH12_00085 [Candidatus Bathyarchaeota archaeon]|jgi:hypothetical protein